MSKRGEEGYADSEEDHAKNKGNELLSYLLDCVQRGNCDDIQVALKDPEFSALKQLVVGNELSFAQMVFQYVAPQIARAALNGGMSWVAATAVYQNYINKAQIARTAQALFELYNQMFLDFAANASQSVEDNQFSSLVRKCRSYICNHLYEPLSIGRIAEAIHISTSYLSHVYKQETGETISDFVRHKKISEAKILLQLTSSSLAEIGEQLGYCSQSHFTEIFRKETGMTPRQFRIGS